MSISRDLESYIAKYSTKSRTKLFTYQKLNWYHTQEYHLDTRHGVRQTRFKGVCLDETFQGMLVDESNWARGRKHGITQKWCNSLFVLKFKIPYKDGLAHGVYTEYDKDGAIHREIDCVNGKIHGSIRDYTHGKLQQTTRVVDSVVQPGHTLQTISYSGCMIAH